MDSSRPRTRKPVTYGSSSRQSLPNTVSAPSQNKGSQTPSKKTPPPQLSKAGRSVNGNVDKRPRAPVISKPTPAKPAGSSQTAATATTTTDNVYDIPSSDDESHNLILQRKRRRAGPGPKSVVHLHTAEDKRNESQSVTSESAQTRIENGNAKIEKTQKIATPPRVNSKDRKRVQAQARNIEPQKRTPQKPKTISAIKLNAARQQSVSSSEDELQRLLRRKRSSQESEQDSEPESELECESQPQPQPQPKSFKSKYSATSPAPMNPSPRKYAETNFQSTTPKRRRLVDSLGARERSLDRASSNGLTDSQLSSPVATQSPIRQREFGAGPLSIPSDSQREGLALESNTAPSPHVSSKVTYARQRSFLDDLKLDGGLLADPEEDDLFGPKALAKALPRPSLFDIEEPVDEEGAVRSIHELRQAGGNARYRSTIESIFEDVEDERISVSGRCNAMAQICGKILDPKQTRQFVECGFDKRIVDCLSRDLDIVSATLAFSAFGLISRGRSIPYIIATTAWPKLLETAPLLLEAQKDIASMTRARENNLSKATQKIVQDLGPQIKSALFADDEDTKLSSDHLALFCLKAVVSAFKEKGEVPSGLSADLLRQIVDLLLSECSFEKGNSSEKSQILHLGLFVLEANTTSSNLALDEYDDVLKSIPTLQSLLDPNTVQELQNLYIRVILNITNSSADLCDYFATPPMIKALAEIVMSKFNDLNDDSLSQPEKISQSSLDTVILTLGALINLTEQSENSRIMFLEIGEEQTILDQLLHLFLDNVESTAQVNSPPPQSSLRSKLTNSTVQADSVPKVHHNVAIGYLAVLLLSLCLDHGVRSQVKQTLHDKGLGRKLSVVLSTVDEFMQYHQKIEQMHPMQKTGETGGFLGRLQDLVGQIQFIEG